MIGVRILIILLLVCGFLGADESDIARKGDHNGEAYEVLCNLLKKAVHKWKNVQSRGGVSPLKNALGRTIFGDEKGGDLEALKSDAFPNIYEDVEQKTISRLLWCGDPFVEGGLLGVGQSPWPGHSAPHDLVCLCTVGKNSWPLDGTSSPSSTLCGKSKEVLGAEMGEGWGTISGTSGAVKRKKILKASRDSVTKNCLEDDGQGGDLKDALNKFVAKLNRSEVSEHGNKYRLGDGDFLQFPCSGNQRVCVMYYPNVTATKPWWVDLEEAIQKDDELQPKEKSEDEGSNKENAQKQRKTQNQEKSQLPQEPRTAALKQATPDKQEAEQANPENISSPIATLEEANGTLIIPPCIWFLSAFLLI